MMRLLFFAVLFLLSMDEPALAKQRIPSAKAGPPVTDAVSGMAFIKLPKGCFQMGSPTPVRPKEDFLWPALGITAPLDLDERPVHKVCVNAFAIGQTELTADAWQRIAGAPPPFGSGNAPASGVSWRQVQDFIAQLNRAAGSAKYRLPTEAEWEYACRAGRPKEAQREDVGVIDEAWYAHTNLYRNRPQETGQLVSNPWGLFDMLGNVWEWTEDVYRPDAYRQHGLFNPLVVRSLGDGAADRVIRGASFRSEYLQVRCATRGRYGEAEALPQIGFRLVMTEGGQR